MNFIDSWYHVNTVTWYARYIGYYLHHAATSSECSLIDWENPIPRLLSITIPELSCTPVNNRRDKYLKSQSCYIYSRIGILQASMHATPILVTVPYVKSCSFTFGIAIAQTFSMLCTTRSSICFFIMLSLTKDPVRSLSIDIWYGVK